MDENTNINPEQALKAEVKKVTETMIQQIRNHVPEYGDFAPVMEFFLNPDPHTEEYVGKYSLCIYKMPADVEPDPRMRYVEARAYVPSGQYKADICLIGDYKDKIIDALQKEDFHERLYKAYLELVDMFINYD